MIQRALTCCLLAFALSSVTAGSAQGVAVPRAVELEAGVLGASMYVPAPPLDLRYGWEDPAAQLGWYAGVRHRHKTSWRRLLLTESLLLTREGSRATATWPQIRSHQLGLGLGVEYVATPVVRVVAEVRGLRRVGIASERSERAVLVASPSAYDLRGSLGVVGRFGRWSARMAAERGLSRELGEVVVVSERTQRYRPIYRTVAVTFGLAWRLLPAGLERVGPASPAGGP